MILCKINYLYIKNEDIIMELNKLKEASNLLFGKHFNFYYLEEMILCNLIVVDEFNRGFKYEEHAHSFLEVHYLYDGKGKISIGRREYEDRKSVV